MWNKSIYLSVIFIVISLLTCCSTPEEKKMGYYTKAKTLYEQNELVKARIELRKAIRIDPKFVDAYYLLAMLDLKSEDIRGAYGNLIRMVRASPPEHPCPDSDRTPLSCSRP